MRYRDARTKQMVLDPKRRGFHKRTRFGVLKRPSDVYTQWKENREEIGLTWKQLGQQVQQRRKKDRIARASRKANR